MRASPQLSQAHESHLSEQSLGLLRGLLVAEADTQVARFAAHEALISQLRDLTDADSVLERELAEAGALRARETIEDVEHAVERIQLGTYGSCEACGVPMPFERLEAIPWARLCVACPGRRVGWQR